MHKLKVNIATIVALNRCLSLCFCLSHVLSMEHQSGPCEQESGLTASLLPLFTVYFCLGQCLLDSLRVVGDFFALEFAARQPEEDRRFGCLSDARETLSGCEGLLKVAIPPGLVGEASPRTPVECESPSQSGSGWTDKAPTSPLQAMLMFATLSPGDMPPLAVLEPYCKVLQRALEPEPVTRPLASDAAIGTPEAPVLGSFPSEVSTASGDSFVHRCQLGEALVCLDTDGSGTVEFDEFLAASMTRADFKEREPACR